MGRVLTNNTSLQFAAESTTPKTLPGSPTWFLLEPENVNTFGQELKTVARRPISKNRQNKKGAVVDKDSAVEFEHDLTLDVVDQFLEAFVYGTAGNANLFFRAADVDLTTNDGFVIPAATASQAGKIQWATGAQATLLYSRGYATAANNGLFVLTADLATSGTKLICDSQSLVAETAPANATVEVCGIRASTGDLAITVTSGVATLTSGGDIDFTTIGWTIGQYVHIGGLTTGEQFSAGVGYGRLTALAASSATFDRLVGTLATDNGTGDTVDLLFGRFFRNVSVDATDTDGAYIERTFHVEGAFPNLGAGGATEYEYVTGAYANEIKFNLPLTDKATATFAFVALNTEDFTTSRKTNAASAIEPVKTTAINTSSDFAALTVRDSSDTDLSVYFKSATLTLGNNVSGEKVLATLGSAFVNVGIFDVSLEAQLVFTTSAVPDAIKNNETVSFYAILTNDDGAIAIDIPSMTFSGGGKEYPLDQSILINITGKAFQDATTGTSIGISTFPVVP